MEKIFENTTNLESIEIIGLFNKQNFCLKFNDPMKILISENGSGKTTILNIIVSFLKGDLLTLKKLPFSEIKIKLKNDKKEHFFRKSKLFKSFNKVALKRLKRELDIMLRHEFNSREIIEELFYKYGEEFYFHLEQLKNKIPYDSYRRIYDVAEYFLHREEFEIQEDKLYREFLKKLNFNVEYLPTYRRIEKEYFKEVDNRIGNETEINFGMRDVEKIIKTLTQEITTETHRLFSEMNNEILYELLNNNKILTSQEKNDLVSNPKIEIVLSRIKNLNDNSNIIESLAEAINQKDAHGEFLGYYLLKILNIYEKQEEKEKRIRCFIDICNSYLYNKKFIYLAEETKIKILDEDENEILLSTLSSGEKQIISLFSKLYLENKENLMIIIDEPELSISMIWQKRILPDIMKSDKCNLLLTTTHSPFIFENEFDIYANELKKYITFYAREGE